MIKPLVILGIVSFLRTVLVILLVYYGVRLLLQVVSPYLKKWIQKKAMEKMGGFSNGGFNQQETTKEEGEVTIDKNKTSTDKPSKTTIKDQGEYVDFEEVD
ncbi:DUF4834 family protein [Halosquirtibacter xylanolyticus]|uniref:DUF4834 family protein n=1 Tax=Halosquirtibacter xylanolyticus TaxID=3374599 RepID=UPI00374A285E|nr:DUF4834 family protein [Prolixibacteraceae bacterium]